MVVSRSGFLVSPTEELQLTGEIHRACPTLNPGTFTSNVFVYLGNPYPVRAIVVVCLFTHTIQIIFPKKNS